MSRAPQLAALIRRNQDRWKRYQNPSPGAASRSKEKFMVSLLGSRRKHYQFTAIDDCTRSRVLRIDNRLNQKTVIPFVDYVPEKLPFRVEIIQTDNGAAF